ncbi:MAG: GNAT family N-acetyltransferase [Anaerocolumna sp.]
MIIKTKHFFVDTIAINDYDEIVDLYNTNIEFLEKHQGIKQISREWFEFETTSMKELNYITCKIIDSVSGKILGIFDYLPDTETYLSIIIFHKDCKGRGIGSEFLEEFFIYLKSIESLSLRVDVVTGYNDQVLNFWTKHGFQIYDHIQLNWNDTILPAVSMRKYLS